MFLLDTNVISELRKLGDGKADARVTAWVSGIEAASTYLSVITLMELDIGILRLERRDARQGERLRAWFQHQVVPEFKDRTLPIEARVAHRGPRCPLLCPAACPRPSG